MSHRQRDSNVEKEIADFLDEFFYPKTTSFASRFEEKEDQLKGKDILIKTSKTGRIIVDEKAATHYINKDIPTFAFELSFCRYNGERVKGWLFDKSKETEYYLVMWIEAETDKTWLLKAKDIKRIKAVLLNRQDLIDYLEQEGFDYDETKQKEQEILRKGQSGRLYKYDHRYVSYFYTTRLDEKPINLVVKRIKLEQLATNRFLITRDEVKTLEPLSSKYKDI